MSNNDFKLFKKQFWEIEYIPESIDIFSLNEIVDLFLKVEENNISESFAVVVRNFISHNGGGITIKICKEKGMGYIEICSFTIDNRNVNSYAMKDILTKSSINSMIEIKRRTDKINKLTS